MAPHWESPYQIYLGPFRVIDLKATNAVVTAAGENHSERAKVLILARIAQAAVVKC